jgi:hypothetical protein
MKLRIGSLLLLAALGTSVIEVQATDPMKVALNAATTSTAATGEEVAIATAALIAKDAAQDKADTLGLALHNVVEAHTKFFGLFNILAGAGSLAIGLGGGLGLGYLFFKKGDVKTPVPVPEA